MSRVYDPKLNNDINNNKHLYSMIIIYEQFVRNNAPRTLYLFIQAEPKSRK